MKIILSDQLKHFLIGKLVKYCYVLLIAFIGYMTFLISGKVPYSAHSHFLWKFILCFIQGVPFFLVFISIKVARNFIVNNIFIQWK